MDNLSNNNYWQSLFLNEGHKLLADRKRKRDISGIYNTVHRVVGQNCKALALTMSAFEKSKVVTEICTLTDEFLCDFHKNIQEKYEEELQEHEHAH